MYEDRLRCWKEYKDNEGKLMKINKKDMKMDESL